MVQIHPRSGSASLSVPDIHQRIIHAGASLGLNVSRETLAKIVCYVEQLQKWNRTYNLTALRTIDEILVSHVFDCMSIVPEIQSLTGNESFRLLDVGSGAGLPGVIVGAFFPQSEVTCVDSVEKKTTFIRHVSTQMGCMNVSSIHERVERLDPMSVEFVISRAFASLSLFAELAGKHVKDGGWLFSMKAAQVKEDIAALERTSIDWNVSLIEQLSVPESNAKRYLVGLQRKEVS